MRNKPRCDPNPAIGDGYKEIPNTEAERGDEFYSTILKEWLPIDAGTEQKRVIVFRGYLVRRKIKVAPDD